MRALPKHLQAAAPSGQPAATRARRGLTFLMLVATLAVALGTPLRASADEEASAPAADKAAKKQRETFTARRQALEVQVEVDGRFVSGSMAPVALRPEAWSRFKIERIVPHGAKVRAGDVLVEFEAKELNREIADLEISQRLAELSLRRAEEELPRIERSLEMAVAQAEKALDRTSDDYQRYQDLDRDRQIEQLKMNLKASKQRLSYAKDELDQLEKMYKADDLTEETEEIILTRQRQDYEMAKFRYERAKFRYEEELSIDLPRQDEDRRDALDKVQMSLERAKLARQIDLNKARYELEQKKVSRDKSLERHAKLVQDRGLLQIKAPADGVVYYGQCVDGVWKDMGSMIGKLRKHSTVSAGTVMMTIVDPRPAYLVATVGEADRPSVEAGQPATVRPTGDSGRALTGSVAEVSLAPVAAGKFRLRVDLSDAETPAWLVPGMTGKIKITTYSKPDALVVSKKAIRTDPSDPARSYVWEIEEEDGQIEVEREWVTVGKGMGDLVEILDGLDEGEVVSLEEDEVATPDDDEEDDEEEDDDEEDEDGEEADEEEADEGEA
ncbi:MAG: HlyD family efflux transporter periplasmic adaptor subunit [Planctomycetota bacterium]